MKKSAIQIKVTWFTST